MRGGGIRSRVIERFAGTSEAVESRGSGSASPGGSAADPFPSGIRPAIPPISSIAADQPPLSEEWPCGGDGLAGACRSGASCVPPAPPPRQGSRTMPWRTSGTTADPPGRRLARRSHDRPGRRARHVPGRQRDDGPLADRRAERQAASDRVRQHPVPAGGHGDGHRRGLRPDGGARQDVEALRRPAGPQRRPALSRPGLDPRRRVGAGADPGGRRPPGRHPQGGRPRAALPPARVRGRRLQRQRLLGPLRRRRHRRPVQGPRQRLRHRDGRSPGRRPARRRLRPRWTSSGTPSTTTRSRSTPAGPIRSTTPAPRRTSTSSAARWSRPPARPRPPRSIPRGPSSTSSARPTP